MIRRLRNIGTLALVVGIIALIICCVAFFKVESIARNVEEVIGYKPSVEQLSSIFETAGNVTNFLGISVDTLANIIGISAVELIFIQASLVIKTPALIVGIVSLVLGIIIRYLGKN